jgi:hypothetical protein
MGCREECMGRCGDAGHCSVLRHTRGGLKRFNESGIGPTSGLRMATTSSATPSRQRHLMEIVQSLCTDTYRSAAMTGLRAPLGPGSRMSERFAAWSGRGRELGMTGGVASGTVIARASRNGNGVVRSSGTVSWVLAPDPRWRRDGCRRWLPQCRHGQSGTHRVRASPASPPAAAIGGAPDRLPRADCTCRDHGRPGRAR